MRLLKPLGSSHQDAGRFAHAGSSQPGGGGGQREEENGEQHAEEMSIRRFNVQPSQEVQFCRKGKSPYFCLQHFAHYF